MKRRIVVLSDGTGNSAAKVWRTNVWRTFESIDLTKEDQIAFYDDGIGSSSFKPFALIGGIFGYGLKRNTIECYKFICRNYEPGCDIYLFGFSRGAFTIRVLIELMACQGLVSYRGDERELGRRALAAYRAYRKTLHTRWRIEGPFRFLRDTLLRTNYGCLRDCPLPQIRFVGLWDTVAAYGLPFEELTRFVNSWIFPLNLSSRDLPACVSRACHALALDEERTTFRPLMMTDPDQGNSAVAPSERISQVWFCGVHSNVGGGYPDDSLSRVPLGWMIKEASNCELRFINLPTPSGDEDDRFIHGRMYDSRAGLGAYYRYGPRNLTDLYGNDPQGNAPLGVAKIHYSVFKRILRQTQPYAPIGVPSEYKVVGPDSRVLSYETPDQADVRCQHQSIVWNSVFRKSAAYLAVVLITAALVLGPLFIVTPSADEFSSPLRPLSDLIRLVGAFVPAGMSRWVNSYARNPGTFFVAVAALIFFLILNSRLKARIGDSMRRIWSLSLSGKLIKPRTNWFYQVRTNSIVRGPYELVIKQFVPAVAIVASLAAAFLIAVHFVSNFADAAGAFCTEGQGSPIYERGEAGERKGNFYVNDVCWNTGVRVEAGVRYEIAVRQVDDWRDGDIDVDIGGGRSRRSAILPFKSLLKRSWDRPLFWVVARVGSVGSDEWFLDPDRTGGRFILEIIRPGRDGDLFLYVNDVLLPVPGLYNYFYRDNFGKAEVTIRRRS